MVVIKWIQVSENLEIWKSEWTSRQLFSLLGVGLWLRLWGRSAASNGTSLFPSWRQGLREVFLDER